MKNLKSIILTTAGLALVSLSLAGSGCKDDAGDCDKVVAHTLTLLPAEFAESAKADMDGMKKKCEEASPEARKCALNAKTMEALGACPRK